jgi:hypothetical protein
MRFPYQLLTEHPLHRQVKSDHDDGHSLNVILHAAQYVYLGTGALYFSDSVWTY